MTNSTPNLDDRLKALITVGEQQQKNIASLAGEFSGFRKDLTAGLSEFRKDLSELKEIVRQQAATAASQQETIRQFAGVFAQQARTISELSRSVQASVESSRQAAQAAQAAAVVAQDNQNAIRDLIEELRQGRQ